MLKKISLLLFVAATLGLVSCQKEYDKLLKSNDYGEKLKKAYEYYDAEDYYKAQILFEQVRPFYRGTDELETIYFKYAYTQFYQKKYILASYYFKDFATNFPNSSYTEEAQYMTAYSNYKMSPNHRLDQSYTEKAIDGFQLFVNNYPNSDKVGRCNALIDEMRAKLEQKAIAQADLYLQLSEYQAAMQSYNSVLKDYPDTRSAEKIRLKIIEASYKLATNSVDSKKAERYQTTIDHYLDFVERHPNSDFQNEAEKYYQSSKEKLKKINS